MPINVPELSSTELRELTSGGISQEDRFLHALKSLLVRQGFPKSGAQLTLNLALSGYPDKIERWELFFGLVKISLFDKDDGDPDIVTKASWIAKRAVEEFFLDDLADNFEAVEKMTEGWWTKQAVTIGNWREALKRKLRKDTPEVSDDFVLCMTSSSRHNQSDI